MNKSVQPKKEYRKRMRSKGLNTLILITAIMDAPDGQVDEEYSEPKGRIHIK